MNRFLVVLIVLCSLVFPALAEWDVPNFQQDDSPWGGEELGNCPLSVTSVAEEGCALTCAANVFSYYEVYIDGNETDPHFLNEKLKQIGGYGYLECRKSSYTGECIKMYRCNCLLNFNVLSSISGGRCEFHGKLNAINNIDEYLQYGPVITLIERLGHFVVVIDKLSDGSYKVRDPLLDLDTIFLAPKDEIRALRWYEDEPLIFLDVPKDSDFTEYIADMKGRGIMLGSDNLFYPYNNISRGEICTMIVRANSLPWNSSYSNPFTDLDAGHDHYQSILICYHLGYVSGIGNQFFPDNPVLRRDASKMICNGFEISLWNTLLNIWRDYSVGDDNYEYAYTLCREGILSGYPDRNFGPNNNLTRAEAAKTFSNALAL